MIFTVLCLFASFVLIAGASLLGFYFGKREISEGNKRIDEMSFITSLLLYLAGYSVLYFIGTGQTGVFPKIDFEGSGFLIFFILAAVCVSSLIITAAFGENARRKEEQTKSEAV